jgi:hypothetical protein
MNVLAAEHRARRRHVEVALLLGLVLAVTGAGGAIYAIKLTTLLDAGSGSLSIASASRR